MVEKAIQSTILSLGYLEDDEYCAEPDCLGKIQVNFMICRINIRASSDGIRDLIRHLHIDDSRMTCRRICTSRGIVKNDLVPILRSSKTSTELFDVALR